MRNISYKYNLGDVVRFKSKFHESASCGLAELAGTQGVVEERRDYNGPCYKLAGMNQFFTEKCFDGSVASKFFTQRDEAVGADTFQGPETNCDTGDSGESESKWYRISFSAKLSPDDLRAMKKCFFDAMNESMEIYDLEGLEIEEA
jgi:hypothetical protein